MPPREMQRPRMDLTTSRVRRIYEFELKKVSWKHNGKLSVPNGYSYAHHVTLIYHAVFLLESFRQGVRYLLYLNNETIDVSNKFKSMNSNYYSI